MPLFYLEGQRVAATPFPETFGLLRARLTAEQLGAAEAAIEKMIEGSEIETSSWMPGADWRGTPFQPIYEIAARYDPNLSAKLFGLLVFDIFRRREEVWYTGRFELDGKPLSGRTYFRPRN